MGAGGWYRLFADEANRTDLQEYGLSWLFGGGLATYTRDFGTFHLTAGAHAYGYQSTHTQDDVDGGAQLHEPRVQERGQRLREAARQPRRAGIRSSTRRCGTRSLSYAGDVGEAGRGLDVLQPEGGRARRSRRGGASAYVSVGRTEREPARADILLGEDNASVAARLRRA